MQTVRTTLRLVALAIAFLSVGSAAESESGAVLPRVAPAIAQLAKLHDSGVSEEIMLAYVQNSSIPRPNAEELIYLHERGVSTPVITSLLKRIDPPAAVADSKPVYEPAPAASTSEQSASQPIIVGSPPVPAQSTITYIPAASPHYTPRYNESYFAPYFGTYPYVGPTFSVGLGFGHFGHHWGHRQHWGHHHHRHHGHHWRGRHR